MFNVIFFRLLPPCVEDRKMGYMAISIYIHVFMYLLTVKNIYIKSIICYEL